MSKRYCTFWVTRKVQCGDVAVSKIGGTLFLCERHEVEIVRNVPGIVLDSIGFRESVDG